MGRVYAIRCPTVGRSETRAAQESSCRSGPASDFGAGASRRWTMTAMGRDLPQSGVVSACAGLLIGALLVGCDQGRDESSSPLDGLHPCEGADEVVGVFTGQVPTRSPHDSDSL